MTKAEKYLYDRLNLLSEEKVNIITKINKITIEIEETENMVNEMSYDMDTAYEMFSPKPKKNNFEKNEIERLLKRKEELILLRDEFVKQSMDVEEDIFLIKDSLGEDVEEENDFDYELEYDHSESETIYGARILEQQEIEKQKIATSLNKVMQLISNMQHKCEMCEKLIDVDSVRAKLEVEILSKNAMNIIDSLRDIIYELKPTDIGKTSFIVVLERTINLYKLHTDMNIEFSVTGNEIKLPEIVEITCLRIIMEACKNSIEYSEGKNIKVNFEYQEDNIHIEVEDDGKGFDVNGETSGISNMKEKTILLSGNIQIQSDDKGTKIIVDVPIK